MAFLFNHIVVVMLWFIRCHCTPTTGLTMIFFHNEFENKFENIPNMTKENFFVVQ